MSSQAGFFLRPQKIKKIIFVIYMFFSAILIKPIEKRANTAKRGLNNVIPFNIHLMTLFQKQNQKSIFVPSL